ncbi:Anaerobic magnesium-protoporphyrin IX monomethyl ester cyclase [subsurface metagenome]
MGSYDPPLGIMYLGGFLRKHGIDVNLIDLSFSKKWNEYRDELLRTKPDLVGISCLSPFFGQVLLAASITRRTLPNCKIVMGGAHPTALPKETIKSPDVDFVVAGEGEVTLTELIKTLERGGKISEVKGILYKENGKIFQTPLRECIQNLDEIPFPARDLLPTWEKYLSQTQFFPYLYPYTTIMGARGCPFNCSFCQPVLRKLFGQRIRLRSPQNIIDEVELLVEKYKIKSLFFFDDTFTAVADWVEGICDGFLEKKWGLKWGANSRVNTLSYPLAEKMKKAGCIYVSFGVESGSQKILDESLNKEITLEQIINAFDICKKVGLLSSASLMIGSPGDTRETIQETISLVKKIKPDMIDVHFTTPTPGSYMYERVKDTLLTSQEERYKVGGLKLPN